MKATHSIIQVALASGGVACHLSACAQTTEYRCRDKQAGPGLMFALDLSRQQAMVGAHSPVPYVRTGEIVEFSTHLKDGTSFSYTFNLNTLKLRYRLPSPSFPAGVGMEEVCEPRM